MCQRITEFTQVRVGFVGEVNADQEIAQHNGDRCQYPPGCSHQHGQQDGGNEGQAETEQVTAPENLLDPAGAVGTLTPGGVRQAIEAGAPVPDCMNLLFVDTLPDQIIYHCERMGAVGNQKVQSPVHHCPLYFFEKTCGYVFCGDESHYFFGVSFLLGNCCNPA